MLDFTISHSRPITELFKAQVLRRPDATAILFDGKTITYADLDKLSNQIANKLSSHRYEQETCVGVCLDRSHYAVAAMLGIMRAGLAFVPLDPDFPENRLKYMIDDAAINCCLTQTEYLPLLEGLVTHNHLVESDFAESTDSDFEPEHRIEPDHLAYIMYTSGSTGNPKGVQIEHGALTNYCQADSLVYELVEDDITLQFSTLNFDIAIEEIFPPLICGSAIAVRPQQRSDALNELSDLITRYNVTALHIATAYWHEWVNLLVSTGAKTPESIRLMVVTGEKVSSEHYRTWLSHTQQKVLWANAYGPTETTVTATVFIPPENWAGDNLPIGKPLKGYSARILNSDLLDVGQNETGELFIGGLSLARGYLNHPDLTEQSFITAANGENLYRTGDLARFLESGDIEYAGRIDHQIKIGSYRIEPGEIEDALNRHPDIRESLVVATDAPSGGTRQIVAYVACDDSLTLQQIHQFLIEQLPPFMLPAGYLQLEKLPKTINGKVDRESLPPAGNAKYPVSENIVHAKSKIEEDLVAIWSTILGRSSFGVTDNFFDLGGSSLRVTQCILQIQNTLGKSPTAREFYAGPTIANISRLLENPAQSQAKPLLAYTLTDANLELTDNQYQIWFQQKLHPDLTIYNIYESFDITGHLDIEKLQCVITELLAKHKVLNVVFSEKDGRCFQTFPPKSTHPYSHPVSVVSDESIDPGDWMKREIHRPFDLSNDPVYRFTLLQYAENRYRLVLTVHHIIADGWSMTLLIRELGALYNTDDRVPDHAVDRGVEMPADSTAHATNSAEFYQYVNYANQQKTSLSHQQQLEYWKDQLASTTPQELPQAQAIVGERHYSADEISFAIPITEQRLTSVCEELSATPFMLLLSVFKALLYRYSPAEKVSVAVAHSGRSWPEVDETFGLFVNTLITSTEFRDNDTTAAFLSRVRQSTLSAFANQEVSLSELVNALQPDRQRHGMPFTPFLFLMQDIPDTDLLLTDLETQPCFAPTANVDYDLLLEITENPGDSENPYSARLVFADEIYNRSDMERMSQHYQRLTEAMLQSSQLPIAALPILSPDEHLFLRESINQTELVYPKDSSLSEELSQTASTFSKSTAVRFESMSLSYEALQTRVEQLAGHLATLGVEPNTLVGVFIERGVDMLVAMLAIQHAGAAYLPMDPLYPAERIEYIIGDAQAPLLITESSLENALPQLDATIICMDRDWSTITQSSPLQQPVNASPEDLAYVIYTSGSTGKPKGVQLTRRNVLNFLFAMLERPGLTSEDTLTAVTTISFDIAVLELYLPLLCGACVDIVSRETATNGSALSKRITEASSTVMQATPATWRLLLETDWKHPDGFKALIGGEALPQDLIAPLLNRSDELWNMYGPTETTVWSTCAKIIDADLQPSIGTPIGNTQIYILSDQQQISPINIPGELCIGGDGVALGYANQPKLTAEKFIPNSVTRTGQLYRTGDSARVQADGSIEFLGRMDNQIKLRGYRIEPGEIEKSVSEVDTVEQAVVTVNQLPEGEFLTAYIVSTAPIMERELRERLAKSLPDYMIPSLWVELESIPLTPNGKVDRKALPPPTRTGSKNKISELPATPTEKAIAELWTQLLPDSTPGRDDNFFSLGGHSLLAMRFIARAKEQLGYSVPIRSLMSENLAGIAEQINPEEQLLAGSSISAQDKFHIDFDSHLGRSLLTVLHEPSSENRHQATTSRAVLICQPICNDYQRMHKSVQRLGCELAKAGHTVLRFDYSGTGDSEGEFSSSRLAHWQEDIRRAYELLKTVSQYEKVSLVGIRLGAPLMTSAKLPDTDRVILWDPVTSGSQWIKEQQSLHRHELGNLDRYRWAQKLSRKHEILGYQFSEELIKDLNHLELGTHADKFDTNTIIISSSDYQIDSILSNDFPHSLGEENLSIIDDGQRWEDGKAVDDMVLGHRGIKAICDRL